MPLGTGADVFGPYANKASGDIIEFMTNVLNYISIFILRDFVQDGGDFFEFLPVIGHSVFHRSWLPNPEINVLIKSDRDFFDGNRFAQMDHCLKVVLFKAQPLSVFMVGLTSLPITDGQLALARVFGAW